jgi:DNA segregation ATPase FtsK/SpoIIIE-like protein
MPGLNEVRIVLGVAVCVWLFLALATASPADASFFNHMFPTAVVSNWCGWLGAQCAAWLTVVCGSASWLCVGMLLVSVFPRPGVRWYYRTVTAVSGATMIAAVALLDALVAWSPVSGGIIGRTLMMYMAGVGGAGTGMVAALILFFSTLVFTRTSLARFVHGVVYGTLLGVRSGMKGVQLVASAVALLMPRKKEEQSRNTHDQYVVPEVTIETIPDTETTPLGTAYPFPTSSVAQDKKHDLPHARPDNSDVIAEASMPSHEQQPAQYASPEIEADSSEHEMVHTFEHEEAERETVDEAGDDDDTDTGSGGGSALGAGGPSQSFFDRLPQEPEKIENEETEEEEPAEYIQPASFNLPPLAALFTAKSTTVADEAFIERCKERGRILEEKLAHFGINGRVCNIRPGPIITLFEYEPEVGNKVSRILALEDDLALSLKALSIRILAPIPGQSVVGFEIANEKRSSVMFGDIIGLNGLAGSTAHLPLALGVDIVGNPVIADLATMPHLLVAGATGAGKSVGMNVMLVSLLARVTPDKVRIILIDPKRLEFTPYADIPHLLFPIITNPTEVPPVLKWVAEEMELRYELMAQMGVRNIAEYHKLDPALCFAKEREVGIHVHGMPYIVIMIDELADLIMVGGREIEMLIARIAQMARAAGIHMLVATQRPSVDVVTGLIKANFPSRIAFRVSTKIDSRTIIDSGGAEKLLGRGDMLYMSPSSMVGIQRLHGAYLTDKEIDALTAYLKQERPASYFSLRQVVAQHSEQVEEYNDPLYDEVCQFIDTVDEISISLLQRKYRVGFNRSARLIEMLERDGYVAAAQGGKPRRVLRD